MLSHWPIRNKLVLGIAILALIVVVLSCSGLRGVYAYRELVRSVSHRANELPLLADLTKTVDQMRFTFSQLEDRRETFPGDGDGTRVMLREEFRSDFSQFQNKLQDYKAELEGEGPTSLISDRSGERETVRQIERYVESIRELNRGEYWVLDDVHLRLLDDELREIQQLAHQLPLYLQSRMNSLHGAVRGEYRTLIALTGLAALGGVLMLGLLGRLFYLWIFQPLRVLIAASRRVAAGEFHHRVRLRSHDEMSELAGAMNAMTKRFEEIRDELDSQVKQRTKEVVRSEQLASVGFLAAGVAHEINNPLASIAWSAESLEARLGRLLPVDEGDERRTRETDVVRKYLRRIQEEAFRCKGITERLLDYSRLGDVDRHEVELRELVQGVIEMVRDLGKYRQKQIVFECSQSVVCVADPQELKQVVLNLITNALDSLAPEGRVVVQLRKVARFAELVVADNGCGMTSEVLEHLFEPFFTRRRDGQGTGLGLSIAYRIINDHGGRIDAHSEGPGRGSKLRVHLPLAARKHEQQGQELRPVA